MTATVMRTVTPLTTATVTPNLVKTSAASGGRSVGGVLAILAFVFLGFML
jgi:hypothetical protein